MRIATVILLLLVVIVAIEAARFRRTRKPGRCPRISKADRLRGRCRGGTCRVDIDCPGAQKCCGCPKRCISRGRPRPPPGRCPIRVPRRPPPFCARVGVVSECLSDRDCSSGERCCPPSKCGGGQCIKIGGPRPPRPPKSCPRLPKVPPPICSRVRVARLCESDSECRGGKTCCPGSCGGTSCIGRGRPQPPPPPPPPPSCPVLPAVRPEICNRVRVGRLCESDSSCDSSRRCCPGSCGGTSCVNPGGAAPLG